MSENYNYIGKGMPVRDAALKVTGQMQYVADNKLPRMLHAKMLFSPYAHAKIKKIDTSKAEALPGVRAVATYLNSPRIIYNSALRFYEHKIPETEYVFDDTVRYVGDRVAAVAADDIETAKKAIKLIEVEYEELPAVFNEEEAMKEEAVKLHGDSNIVGSVEWKAGDIEEAFKKADHIFEDKYTMPAIHHGAMEPHVTVAYYDARGKLTVWTPNQSAFAFRTLLSRIFELPMSKVRVIKQAIGGAFGAKVEMVIEPVVALLSKMSGRPVKMELNRPETMVSTRTRHAATAYVKTGVMNDGTIIAQDLKVITNTGAYASSALNIIGAMSHKVFKVYKTPNMNFTGIAVMTNTPVAGAMRGYGSPQGFTGQQIQMNKIAKALNIDVVELQLKNLVEPDGIDQRFKSPLGNPRPIDCVKEAAKSFGWQEKKNIKSEGRYLRGVGMAVGAHGNGMYGAHRDVTALSMKMNEDGTCILYTGALDMGNGSVTLQTMIAAEILGIDPGSIDCIEADTDAVPWNLAEWGSRGTFVVGNATVKVAKSLRDALLKEAALLLEESPEDLYLKDYSVFCKKNDKKATLSDVVVNTQKMYEREIMVSESFASSAGISSYGSHFAEVEVDTETGAVKVLNYVAAHDVGKALNPISVEGQIEGAIQMGIGYALTEGLEFDEKGKVTNASLKKYHMLTAREMPEMTAIIVDGGEEAGPFGGKSIGECSVVPSAPAIVNAVANALGRDFYNLPLKPDKILKSLS